MVAEPLRTVRPLLVARAWRRVTVLNLFVAGAFQLAALGLAADGRLDERQAVLATTLVSPLVIANSLRLRVR